jgi:hypothetical protein
MRLVTVAVLVLLVTPGGDAWAEPEAEPAEVEAAGDDALEAAEPEPDQEGEAADRAEAAEVAAEALAEGEDPVASGPVDFDPDGDMVDASGEVVPKEPKAYAEYLRRNIAKVREPVMQKVRDKILAKQSSSVGRVIGLLSWLSLAGLLLLLAPLVLARKYPGKGPLLWKSSAIAAVTFVVAVNLFVGALLLVRGAQTVAGQFVNPQVGLVNGALDTLDHKAEDFTAVRNFLQPTINQLQGGEVADVPVALLNNASKFQGQVEVFQTIKGHFKKVGWLMGYLPIVLTLVALVLFALAARPVLSEIVKLPARAAGGDPEAIRSVVRSTFRRIGQEFLTALCFIGVLLLVTMISGFALTQALEPVMNTLLNTIMIAFLYVQLPDISAGLVTFAVLGALVFLVLTVAAYVLGSALFLGKAQKIFQRRFVERVPLASHEPFWLWGSASLMAVFTIPVVFMVLASVGIEAWVDSIPDDLDVAGVTRVLEQVMTWVPVILVVGYLVFFWAGRGVKALGFLKSYPVVPRKGRRPASDDQALAA